MFVDKITVDKTLSIVKDTDMIANEIAELDRIGHYLFSLPFCEVTIQSYGEFNKLKTKCSVDLIDFSCSLQQVSYSLKGGGDIYIRKYRGVGKAYEFREFKGRNLLVLK